MAEPIPDVVGVGALNVDYIASASRLSRRAAERVAESTSRFEWNKEGPVEETVVLRAMEELGTHSLDASLGGSAWNTIFALGQMETGLRLGYVGVLGRVEAPGLSFKRQMDILGIDRRMVAERLERRAGVCLSFIEDAERVMLTTPCANLAMADYVRDEFDSLAAYLAAANLVHLTSFLDDASPEEVLRLIRQAKRLNPSLVLSFDPGHEWAVHPTPAILELLSITNILFVNYREFKGLADYSHGELDEAMGRRLTARCGEQVAVFVTKRYDLIEVFVRHGASFESLRYSQDLGDSNEHIEDATGAGDVFAASVIAAFLAPTLQVELGAQLGLSLARQKLRHMASTGHSRFPDLTRGFLATAEETTQALVKPTTVLLAHDGGEQWNAARICIERTTGLPVVELVPTDPHSLLSSTTRRHLRTSGFAVCIFAAGSADADGGRADERLVHYAGFLQGRFGFSKVAILVEAGCRTFSNVSGLIQLSFRQGHIEDAFVELERMIRREGMATTSRGC